MATHFSVLAWKIPWTEDPVGGSPCGCKELDMTEVTKQSFSNKKSVKEIVHSVAHTNVSTILVLNKTFVVVVA